MSILISIQQKWWEKILSGEKTLEIRKTAPRLLFGLDNSPPCTVFVYVSGTGAVQGQFSCPGIIQTADLASLVERACVPLGDLSSYAGRKRVLYGWEIAEPEQYDTPRPLAEFGVKRPPMSWQYVDACH